MRLLNALEAVMSGRQRQDRTLGWESLLLISIATTVMAEVVSSAGLAVAGTVLRWVTMVVLFAVCEGIISGTMARRKVPNV